MVAILKTESYEEWFDGFGDLNAKAIIDTRLMRLALGNPGKTRSVGEGVQE